MTEIKKLNSALGLVFIGQILLLTEIIPWIGWLTSLAGLVLSLVGLAQAGGINKAYKQAFLFTLIALVATFLANIFDVMSVFGAVRGFVTGGGGGGFTGLLATVLHIGSFAVSVFAVMLVCGTTAQLLGNGPFQVRSDLVQKLFLICYGIRAVVTFLSLFSFMGSLMGPFEFVATLIGFVGVVLYLLFIYSARAEFSKMVG